MTANDIYTLASAFIFERPGKDRDFEDFFLPFLNSVLAEALTAQNHLNAASGAEKWNAAPTITDMAQEVPYHDTLCKTALPFGVVSYYFQDEGEEYKAQDFRGRFVNALAEAARGGIVTEIRDIFGGWS